jgi:hypothetical protein
MSILKDIVRKERFLRSEIQYYKDKAKYWEERYWKEKMDDIHHAEQLHGQVLAAILGKIPAKETHEI